MRTVDLFAGCGGMSLGFTQAGFDIVGAFEYWKPAIDVYEQNFNHPVFDTDLSNERVAIEQVNEFDPQLIVGGPPCQDFSSAGKRDQSLGRADMTYHFANIVCNVSPEWFVMENVEQIKKSEILSEVIEQFGDNGYGLSPVILDASYCGVPQARTRFFLIGRKDTPNRFMEQIYLDRMASKPMTMRDYFGNKLGIDYYYRHPRNYNRRGVFSMDEPSATIRGVNRPIPSGYKLISCDPKGVKLEDIRPLTSEERAQVQTFPKTFEFSGTKTSKEQMIGNAVPVRLAKFIAEGIKVFCNMESVATEEQQTMFGEVLSIVPERSLHKMRAS